VEDSLGSSRLRRRSSRRHRHIIYSDSEPSAEEPENSQDKNSRNLLLRFRNGVPVCRISRSKIYAKVQQKDSWGREGSPVSWKHWRVLIFRLMVTVSNIIPMRESKKKEVFEYHLSGMSLSVMKLP
jgi:hypothetical protein